MRIDSPYMSSFAKKNRFASFCPKYNRVEKGANGDSCGEGDIPVIANGTADSKGVYEGEIGDGNEYDVEANDDEGADGKVGDDG